MARREYLLVNQGSLTASWRFPTFPPTGRQKAVCHSLRCYRFPFSIASWYGESYQKAHNQDNGTIYGQIKGKVSRDDFPISIVKAV